MRLEYDKTTKKISIHTLAQGVTLAAKQRLFKVGHISIHTPAQGVTRIEEIREKYK